MSMIYASAKAGNQGSRWILIDLTWRGRLASASRLLWTTHFAGITLTLAWRVHEAVLETGPPARLQFQARLAYVQSALMTARLMDWEHATQAKDVQQQAHHLPERSDDDKRVAARDQHWRHNVNLSRMLRWDGSSMLMEAFTSMIRDHWAW